MAGAESPRSQRRPSRPRKSSTPSRSLTQSAPPRRLPRHLHRSRPPGRRLGLSARSLAQAEPSARGRGRWRRLGRRAAARFGVRSDLDGVLDLRGRSFGRHCGRGLFRPVHDVDPRGHLPRFAIVVGCDDLHRSASRVRRRAFDLAASRAEVVESHSFGQPVRGQPKPFPAGVGEGRQLGAIRGADRRGRQINHRLRRAGRQAVDQFISFRDMRR